MKSDPLRVLLVTETFPPEINGVAMTTGHMVSGLRGRGHWVGVIRPRRDRSDRGGELEWVVPGMALPTYPGVKLGLPAWRRVSRLLRTHRPDVVHVVTEGPLGWVALLVARHLGVPVTSGYHTHFDQYSSHYGLKWLGPWVTRWLDGLHRRCHATLVPTPELAETLKQRGIPNVRVVGRGVDTTLFAPSRRDPALRRDWGVVPDETGQEAPPVCLYVGRMAPEKNLGTVTRAFAAIRAKVPQARMVWVGDGPSLASLRQAHPEHIFAGPRTGEDLARHYASADLFLFASLTETWGNVVGEALASGIGVVAYRRAAAQALMQDGVHGRCPQPGDESAFIEAALQLAQETSRRQACGQQAALNIRHSAWDTILMQMEGILREAVIGEPQGREILTT